MSAEGQLQCCAEDAMSWTEARLRIIPPPPIKGNPQQEKEEEEEEEKRRNVNCIPSRFGAHYDVRRRLT